jgi:hypothetical protein
MRCHNSVEWIYHTGWQNVYFHDHFAPLILPMTNAIQDLEITDNRVVVREHAMGDFGGGRYMPRAELDIETGRLLSYEYCKVQVFSPPENMKVDHKSRSAELENGWRLSWECDKTFRVHLHRGHSSDDRIMVLERHGYGGVGGWLLIPDHNALLLAVACRKAIGLWEAESYLLYIDFSKIDAQLQETNLDSLSIRVGNRLAMDSHVDDF